MWNTGACAGAALLLVAGAAVASCPAGPDALNAGIVVRYDDGSVSTFRAGEDGVIVEEAVYNDPDNDYDVDVIRALFGIYEIESIGISGGLPVPDSVVRRTFDTPLSDLPRPGPDLRWTGTTQVTYGLDPAVTAEITVAAGVAQRVDYGDCGYDSVLIVLREVDPDGEHSLAFDWLPDLGIAVFRAYSEPGDPPDLYTPVSIELAGTN